MPTLIITTTDGHTQRFTLGDRPVVMGRDEQCDIPLPDPSASRRHARFSLSPRGYLVEDLGSKNGTLVNDLPCVSKVLEDGDQTQIGASLAVFHDGEPPGADSVVVAEDMTVSQGTHYATGEKRLDLSQKRLEMIYELSGRLTTLQSQEQLFQNAMDICADNLRFERCAIGIRRSTGRALDWPVVCNLRGAEGEITISRTLLSRALEHGERAIFTEEGTGTTDPTVSIVQQGIRSAMCVPLFQKDEVLGVIYGDRVSTSAAYVKEDIDFFAGIAQQVSIGLINARLVDEQQQMVRLNHDIDLARSIQTGLFPADLPNRAGFKIAALNDPGHRVSGDYYDVIDTEAGPTWCLIADVTGEGVSAALLMANLQAAVRVTIDQTDDPGQLLAQWNRLVWRNTDSSKFITCLLALIDPEEGKISFASAGHHLPLIVRPHGDVPQELSGEPGYPLGIEEDAEFPTTTVDVGSDPYQFFCYTDGVIEAMSNEGKMFGMERLRTALQELRDQNPQAVVKQIRKRITTFVAGARQSDDITVLAVRVN